MDEFGQAVLGVNRDPVWVEAPRKLGGILATFDIRNLGCRECDDLEVLVTAEKRVEVVEVTARGSHDEYAPFHVHIPLCWLWRGLYRVPLTASTEL